MVARSLDMNAIDSIANSCQAIGANKVSFDKTFASHQANAVASYRAINHQPAGYTIVGPNIEACCRRSAGRDFY